MWSRLVAPMRLEVEVMALSDRDGTFPKTRQKFDGQAAWLRYDGRVDITCFTRPPSFHVRVCYDGLGLLPEQYDLVVIKTPHAQPEMYDNWCLVNFNTDCPGATSANVRTLGHTIAKRPLYPLEGPVRQAGGDDKYPPGHERMLGQDFDYSPDVELYTMTPTK